MTQTSPPCPPNTFCLGPTIDPRTGIVNAAPFVFLTIAIIAALVFSLLTHVKCRKPRDDNKIFGKHLGLLAIIFDIPLLVTVTLGSWFDQSFLWFPIAGLVTYGASIGLVAFQIKNSSTGINKYLTVIAGVINGAIFILAVLGWYWLKIQLDS